MSIQDSTSTTTRPKTAAETNGRASSAAQSSSTTSDLAGAARTAGEELGAAAKIEFNNIMADLQDLVRRAGSLSGQELTTLRQQMSEKLGLAKEKLGHLGEDASGIAHKGVDNTEKMIKEHPLQAVGIAAFVGVAIGLLLNRR